MTVLRHSYFHASCQGLLNIHLVNCLIAFTNISWHLPIFVYRRSFITLVIVNKQIATCGYFLELIFFFERWREIFYKVVEI